MPYDLIPFVEPTHQVSPAQVAWELYQQAKRIYPYASRAVNYLRDAYRASAARANTSAIPGPMAMVQHRHFDAGRRSAVVRPYAGSVRFQQAGRQVQYLKNLLPSGATRGFLRSGGAYRYAVGLSQLKWLDTFSTDWAPVSKTTLNKENICVVPQNTSPNGRIGNRICVKKIELNIEMNLPASTAVTNSTDSVYFFVIQDMQTNAGSFAATDVLTAAAEAPRQMRNLENTMRFKMLWQKRLTMSSVYAGVAATDSSGWKQIQIRAHIKCNVVMEYSSTTGAIGEQKSNSLWICAGTTEAFMNVHSNVRIRYQDLNR